MIGTLATGAGMPVDVVTGDRDLFQLVDDAAGVRDPLRRPRASSRHERVDEAWVLAKYGVAGRPVRRLRDPARRRLRRPAGREGRRREDGRQRCSRSTTTSPASAPRSTTRRSDLAPGPRLKIRDAAAYLEVAPTVVAVARDIDLPRDHLALPRAPAGRRPARLRWRSSGVWRARSRRLDGRARVARRSSRRRPCNTDFIPFGSQFGNRPFLGSSPPGPGAVPPGPAPASREGGRDDREGCPLFHSRIPPCNRLRARAHRGTQPQRLRRLQVR